MAPPPCCFPAAILLRYSALCFAAQAIRSQITFGVDRGDPTDDRARALARLAVNYNDPKFLNMSDQGREQVINQAFVSSVQEMARQDAHQELFDGFWYQLVESVDSGLLTGVDDKGEEQRTESVLERIERKLSEDRRELLNRVSIKERAFVFHREGINQYIEYVSRLSEDIRGARRIVDEGVSGLENAARDGEVISDLRLDPLTERYLALRLLDQCRSEWVPKAQEALRKASVRDIGNAKVRDRLEKDLFESMEEAAGQRRLFNRDQAFLDARSEAQEYYRQVAAAARKVFDAEVSLRQLRSLIDYLERRARQYARLASRMETLVRDLESEAEHLRRGESGKVPPFALRVEVFETLDEPRQRIWDRVYHHLYIDEGRSLATFDRQVLAKAIAEQLKPEMGHDGKVAEKPVEKIVTDLRRSLLKLGEERLRQRIFGDHDDPGLDLARGLELEARLILGPEKPAGHPLTEDEIHDYVDTKFRALHQLAGILARVTTAEARALDDGVKVNRTRQLIIGARGNDPGRASKAFEEHLRSVLASDGKQVKTDTWHDPRLVIVHDVELPIPLYYFQPITDEIELAYVELAAAESLAYPLHTDVNWEKSLPNLNPRQSEITVGWSLKRLIEGLLTRVIVYEGSRWLWRFGGPQDTEVLGENLSSALYCLGEIHHKTDLQRKLVSQIASTREALDKGEEATRRQQLAEMVDEVLGGMSRRELRGEIGRQDVLDRSILRALQQELESAGAATNRPAAASPDDLYATFGSDSSS